MQRTTDEFHAIVLEHQSMVYSIALRLLGEPPAAEEVAQDVFLELHRALGRIDSTEHLVHWLRRVTVHRATDYRRRRQLRPEAAVENRTEVWDESCKQAQAELQGSTKEASGYAVAARLEQMLLSLPMPMRTAIVLRYQEELRPAEIAALLGQPLATVKSNLQRALALLRRKAASALKEYVRA
jgi:RNA polymerase sigma-70 factor (ECF subfamily)